jgi:hypothetical protein
MASEGLGDLSPGQAVARCRWRSICAPHPPEVGEEVALEGCVVLLGPPARLHDDLVRRLWASVCAGKVFMIATEREDTMRHVLGFVDKMGALAALEAATPAGHA